MLLISVLDILPLLPNREWGFKYHAYEQSTFYTSSSNDLKIKGKLWKCSKRAAML